MLAPKLAFVPFALVLAALPFGGGPLCRDAQDTARQPRTWTHDEFHQEIFFAVLEGLYRSGVDDEVVDAVCEIDASTEMQRYFIQGCPICTPALDAFRLYRDRPVLNLPKGREDRRTFGSGLPTEIRERLLGPSPDVRREAIMELVQGWMRARMDALRLDQREREQWSREMEARREKGMAILESLREGGVATYQGVESCPFCDAAADASSSR